MSENAVMDEKKFEGKVNCLIEAAVRGIKSDSENEERTLRLREVKKIGNEIKQAYKKAIEKEENDFLLF